MRFKKKQICSSKFEDRVYSRVKEIVESIPMTRKDYKALNLIPATFKRCSKCKICYHVEVQDFEGCDDNWSKIAYLRAL